MDRTFAEVGGGAPKAECGLAWPSPTKSHHWSRDLAIPQPRDQHGCVNPRTKLVAKCRGNKKVTMYANFPSFLTSDRREAIMAACSPPCLFRLGGNPRTVSSAADEIRRSRWCVYCVACGKPIHRPSGCMWHSPETCPDDAPLALTILAATWVRAYGQAHNQMPNDEVCDASERMIPSGES